MGEFVTITTEEYDELKNRDEFLSCLEAAGVDTLKEKIAELEKKLKHRDDEILRLHQLVNRPSRNHPSYVKFAPRAHGTVGGIDWEE